MTRNWPRSSLDSIWIKAKVIVYFPVYFLFFANFTWKQCTSARVMRARGTRDVAITNTTIIHRYEIRLISLVYQGYILAKHKGIDARYELSQIAISKHSIHSQECQQCHSSSMTQRGWVCCLETWTTFTGAMGTKNVSQRHLFNLCAKPSFCALNIVTDSLNIFSANTELDSLSFDVLKLFSRGKKW